MQLHEYSAMRFIRILIFSFIAFFITKTLLKLFRSSGRNSSHQHKKDKNRIINWDAETIEFIEIEEEKHPKQNKSNEKNF